VFSRKTHWVYTHAVIFVSSTGRTQAMAWCGSQKLAEGQMRYWLSHAKYRFAAEHVQSFELHIVTVDNPEVRSEEGALPGLSARADAGTDETGPRITTMRKPAPNEARQSLRHWLRSSSWITVLAAASQDAVETPERNQRSEPAATTSVIPTIDLMGATSTATFR
jgi:hypothetical protein